MTDAPEKLRTAADHIDDAREILDFGSLQLHGEAIADTPEEIDDVLKDMESTLRKLALLDEVGAEAEADDGH